LPDHEENPPARSATAAIDALLSRLTEALQQQGYTVLPINPDTDSPE